MAETLSQDEIDKLLSAISEGSDDENTIENLCVNTRKIKIYDFKRPDVFSREQLRTISNSFEIFARAYAELLKKTLNKPCSVHVASVDQLTYEEFIRSIPTPSECNIVETSIQGNDYTFITEFDPSLGLSMLGIIEDENEPLSKVDKTTEKIVSKNRDLTNPEIQKWEKTYVKPFLNVLRKSMIVGFDSKIRPITIKKTENNPQFLTLLRPTDMVALVSLEAKMGNREGMISVCIPSPMGHKLCNDYNGIPDRDPTELDVAKFEDSIKVPIKVSLGTTSRSIKDIKGMGEGTIIELDKLAGEPLDVEFDGKVFAKGEVVVIDENFGVRLVEMI